MKKCTYVLFTVLVTRACFSNAILCQIRNIILIRLKPTYLILKYILAVQIRKKIIHFDVQLIDKFKCLTNTVRY